MDANHKSKNFIGKSTSYILYSTKFPEIKAFSVNLLKTSIPVYK